jgi:hypothetical protein
MIPKDLVWHEGLPPQHHHVLYDVGAFDSHSGPILCQTATGEYFSVGDMNWVGGECDCCTTYSASNVVRHAFLFDRAT